MLMYILERDKRKVQMLDLYFTNLDDVTVVNDEFEHFMQTTSVQCVVSPANAFGLMDGGYDLAITQWFGIQLQERVQKYIVDNFYGEQPVGTSFIIETGKENQWLIHTPTMRTPERIVDTRVIYHCMRTALIVARQHNIKSIVFPMFGGLTGGVKPQVAAGMMYEAYRQIQTPPMAIGWNYADESEKALGRVLLR